MDLIVGLLRMASVQASKADTVLHTGLSDYSHSGKNGVS